MNSWPQVIHALQSTLPASTFDAWLSHIQADVQTDRIVIKTPSRMFLDGLKKQCLNELTRAIQYVYGAHKTIEFTIDSSLNAAIAPPAPNIKQASHQIDGAIDPRFDFDNFIVGPCNEFCHAACVAVANKPGENYNPLFIHGGVGLGKSHLIQAVANNVHLKNPNMKIAYRRGEHFTNELISAIRNKETEQFRNKYRNVDLLIIDDVQFIAGRESTQQELFNTFDALYELKKQIILVSDQHPKDMNKLDERLQSRFGWGLVADVQPPELETRLAILKSKTDIAGVSLPDDVAYLLASRITDNVRDLEGALTRLVAYSQLINREITMDMVKITLRDVLQKSNRTIQVEDIQKYICRYYNIKIQDMLSKKRTRNIAFPRQVAMYLSKELTNHSYPEIAECFGGKDHSTIIYACNKIRDMILNEKDFDHEIQKHISSIKP